MRRRPVLARDAWAARRLQSPAARPGAAPAPGSGSGSAGRVSLGPSNRFNLVGVGR